MTGGIRYILRFVIAMHQTMLKIKTVKFCIAPQEAGPHDFFGDLHGPPGQTQPYHYDVQAIPECAHKNLYYYNLTFCLEDNQYPTYVLQD